MDYDKKKRKVDEAKYSILLAEVAIFTHQIKTAYEKLFFLSIKLESCSSQISLWSLLLFFFLHYSLILLQQCHNMTKIDVVRS